MAAKKTWTVEIDKNKDFCGIDAGGIQFAHGVAETDDARMAEWFREHDGYKVTDNSATK